tara:strand:- start:118 stop:594 length:477 start_codon:yes stop_codon:yes gene_type:complete
MKIISNCPICEDHTLHVIEKDGSTLMQCLYCGYATADKYQLVGDKEDNDAYKQLSEEMKSWTKVIEDRIWIPSIMTLPMGIVFPVGTVDSMAWAYAPMVDIPREEQVNYPNEMGGFHETKYDTDESVFYGTFHEAMEDLNKKVGDSNKLNLPKLNKNG